MNFKDENSRIYTIGINAFAIISVITYLLYLIKDNTVAIRLWVFSMPLLMFLYGTREVAAKKNKIGYYAYISAVLALVALWFANKNYS